MKNSKSRTILFLNGLKNLFGVGVYLLLVGVFVEVATSVARQWVSFPFALPFWLKIALTVLGALCCFSGIIWFNKTLNLIKTHLADGENTLKTYGPFNYVRHPLYATLLFTLPPLVMIWFADFLFIVSWILIFISAHFMVLVEERGLVKKFGEEYRIYQKFVPGLFPYKGAGGFRVPEHYEAVNMKYGEKR